MKAQLDPSQPSRDRGVFRSDPATLKARPLRTAAREYADAPTGLAPTRVDAAASAAPMAMEIDRLTGQPELPRFPWLSQRSLALEEAARRRAAFGPGPVLSEVIDTYA